MALDHLDDVQPGPQFIDRALCESGHFQEGIEASRHQD
jgi:hypothetical protein